MAMIFSVEGNIGSGKSTLIKYLKKEMKEICGLQIVYLEEPVDIWQTIKDSQGNDIIKKAYQDLHSKKNKNFNFYGYIEGNHIMDGKVNVIVTDGFTGNIALKTAEGTANFIINKFKNGNHECISRLLNNENLKKRNTKNTKMND